MKKKYSIDTKIIAQVKYFETLHVIKDDKGETLFTGSEIFAKKLLKILNAEKRKARK